MNIVSLRSMSGIRRILLYFSGAWLGKTEGFAIDFLNDDNDNIVNYTATTMV